VRPEIDAAIRGIQREANRIVLRAAMSQRTIRTSGHFEDRPEARLTSFTLGRFLPKRPPPITDPRKEHASPEDRLPPNAAIHEAGRQESRTRGSGGPFDRERYAPTRKQPVAASRKVHAWPDDGLPLNTAQDWTGRDQHRPRGLGGFLARVGQAISQVLLRRR
jgi:hypothetical protein